MHIILEIQKSADNDYTFVAKANFTHETAFKIMQAQFSNEWKLLIIFFFIIINSISTTLASY